MKKVHMGSMTAGWLTMLTSALLCWTSVNAETTAARLLTGNGEAPLRGAMYRTVWTGTNQPKWLGDPTQNDWILFADGPLTDGRPSTLGMHTKITDRVLRMRYWVPPVDYEIEIDLGQICELRKFTLEGWQHGYDVRCWFPSAKRWLTVARHRPDGELDGQGPFRQEIALPPLRTRRLRIAAGDIPGAGARTFSEMYIWGHPSDRPEQLPAPLPPLDSRTPFQGLDLRPAEVPPMAPDPFVLPQPVEMTLDDTATVQLPAELPTVTPTPLGNEFAAVLEDFASGLSALVPVALQPGNNTGDALALYLGLHSTQGPCNEVAERLRVAPNDIAAEGYAIEITDRRIVLVGVDLEGVIWGTQTLQQLLRRRADGSAELPLGTVRDFPRAKLRPAHGYPSWTGPFRHDLLRVMVATKHNLLLSACDDVAAQMATRYRLQQMAEVSLFPASACGLGGTRLEAHPGMKRSQVKDQSRHSADPTHTDFWPGFAAVLDQVDQMREAGQHIQYINVGLDEMFDNPWMVSARGRTRGLTEREALLDALLKAFRLIRARNYKPMVMSTSYSLGVMENQGKNGCSPFEMLLDLPPQELVCWTYGNEKGRNKDRSRRNQALRKKGYFLFAQGAQQVHEDGAYDAGLKANWGNAGRAVYLGELLPIIQMLAEENWSQFDKKVAHGTPAWLARRNRIMDYSRRIMDRLPLDIPGRTAVYHPVNLQPQANRTLQDDVYGDGRGWFDDGPTRDLRHLPQGTHIFAGVAFAVGPRAALVAGPGCADHDLPDQVTGMKVDRQVGELVFLHACRRGHWRNFGKDVSLVGFYRIRFSDDSSLLQPIYLHEHVRPWLEHFGYREMAQEPVASPASGAAVAWRGGTDGGHDVTLYAMHWRNPYPEKTVAAVDLLASAFTETNDNRLALIALTARAVDEEDHRLAAGRDERPPLATFHPRPALPADVVRLDLLRATGPVALARAEPSRALHFQTTDGLVMAQVGNTLTDKAAANCGVYSALHPDDESWRGSGPLEVAFDSPVTIHAIGVKGVMQKPKLPELTPVDLTVAIRTQRGGWREVGSARQHIGETGELRWLLDAPTDVSDVRVTVSHGGISSLNLYGPPLRKARRRALRTFAPPAGLGEAPPTPDEDALDELEGY